MKTIFRSARLSLVLLSGATLVSAGSLAKECRESKPQVSKSVCEVALGRSDAWLKETLTWNQSGSLFSPRYSAVLADQQVKLDEKSVVPLTTEHVAINLN